MKEKLKLMEEYLKQEKPIFIKYEDKIDIETFNKLKELMDQYSKTKFKECFEKCNVSGITFSVEYPCSVCGNIQNKQVSKTKLFSLLESKSKYELECEKCQSKRLQEWEQRNYERKLEEKDRIEEIKENYFNGWLNSEYSLTPEGLSNIYQARNQVISMLNTLNKWEIKDYVNNQMTYKMFLRTPYWQLVSNLARRKAKYKCQLCGGNKTLNVHHKTYENKGFEIINMDDLIVLCQDCHQKFHEVV